MNLEKSSDYSHLLLNDLDEGEILFDDRDYLRSLKLAIDGLTEKLFKTMGAPDKEMKFEFQFENQNIRCGVCGTENSTDNQLIEELRYDDYEYYHTCHICSLHESYVYGESAIYFDGILWTYSHHETMESESYLTREKETTVVGVIFRKLLDEKELSEDEKSYMKLLQKHTTVEGDFLLQEWMKSDEDGC